jgi:hypothetical protein
MLAATIWRDLRWRFAAMLPLVVLIAALAAESFIRRPTQERSTGVTYSQHLDAVWFWLPGPSAIFLLVAVVLGASGVLLRPRANVAYLLSMPVSRSRWLLSNAAGSAIGVALMILITDGVFVAGAWRSGTSLPLLPLLARSLGVLLAACAWIGVTLAAVALVRSALLALTIVLGTLVLLPTSRFQLEIPPTSNSPPLGAWDPWTFADPRAWQSGIPFESLLSCATLGVGGLAVGLVLLKRYEPQ